MFTAKSCRLTTLELRGGYAASSSRLIGGTSSGFPYSSCVCVGLPGWSAASSTPSTAEASVAWSVSDKSSTESSVASGSFDRPSALADCPALFIPTSLGSDPSSSGRASRSPFRSGERSSILLSSLRLTIDVPSRSLYFSPRNCHLRSSLYFRLSEIAMLRNNFSGDSFLQIARNSA